MIGSRAVTDLQLDPSAVFGWVDLHRCRQRLGRWHSTHEALGVCDLSLFEHAAFDLEDGAPASVMHHLGSGIGDTRMTVLGVVPGEEVPAPGACVIIATVAIWVARRVTSNSLTASTCVMPPYRLQRLAPQVLSGCRRQRTGICSFHARIILYENYLLH